MFGKKKIEAVSVLDLRNYTPQALRKISSIQAVSTILAAGESFAGIRRGLCGYNQGGHCAGGVCAYGQSGPV